MITDLKPELATLVKAPPEGDEWLHEIKFDGYRILAFINNNKIRLISRNGINWTKKFSIIVTAIKALKINAAVLDGELVALDKNGRSQFQLLQNALSEAMPANLHYFVFDLPFYKNADLSKKPLLERKKILKSILTKKNSKQIHFSEHVQGDGKKMFKNACDNGLEGIVSKQIDSYYKQRRTDEWVKVKCSQRQEFVIVGFTKPQGNRHYFGSLLLAYYKNKTLIYSGHVGTGFNEKSLAELHKKLSPLKQTKAPVKEIKDVLHREITWVKPALVAEIEFSEWTDLGLLRHPVFKGLRQDKLTTDVKRETVKIKKNTKSKTMQKLSHPEKLLYPKARLTKLEVYNYYDKVAARLLPYIKNRPLTWVRCPTSVTKCFYQKNWAAGLPNSVYSIPVPTEEGESQFMLISNKAGILAAAQLNVLELHPWLSLHDKLSYPNQLIFDLDPSPEIAWRDLIKAAFIVGKVLENLNLVSFVKLTGGKGLHIVVPITRTKDFAVTKNFAKTLGEYLTQQFPKIFTINLKKNQRKNKIFIDYLRNEYGATAIACFSPRANDKAAVAVPISWEKLKTAKKHLIYTIKTIDDYFADYPTDPWTDFFNLKQKLPTKIV